MYFVKHQVEYNTTSALVTSLVDVDPRLLCNPQAEVIHENFEQYR